MQLLFYKTLQKQNEGNLKQGRMPQVFSLIEDLKG